MLRSIFVAILAFISFTASAQMYYGLGYGLSLVSVKGLNAIMDEYNEIRPWLDKDMGQFGFVDGMILNAGVGYEGFWLDMEMAFRSQTRKAQGTPPGGMNGTRQFKLTQNAFAFNLGGMGGNEDGGVGIGLRTEFGGQTVRTRVYNDGVEKGDWNKAYDDLMLNMGPMLKLVLLSDDGMSFTFAT